MSKFCSIRYVNMIGNFNLKAWNNVPQLPTMELTMWLDHPIATHLAIATYHMHYPVVILEVVATYRRALLILTI